MEFCSVSVYANLDGWAPSMPECSIESLMYCLREMYMKLLRVGNSYRKYKENAHSVSCLPSATT